MERLGADIRKITAPPRVLHADVSLAIPGYRAEPGEIREDAVSHERADPNRTVVGAGHRVANPGVDAPHAEAVRQAQAALELRGLAEQRHEAVGFAADRRHLVHDP